MAESNEESSWSWGSWINSAKSKSASVFEAVKQDLNELSTAVSNAGQAIGETLKLDEPESTASTVKKSLSSFFGQVTEALIPSLEDDDTEAVLITTDGTITLTGFQKHLAELQLNDETYLKPPEAQLIENYNRWIEVTEQDQFTQNRLAKHLASSEILNEKYLSFVPDQVPHMEFWKRYLFKRAILEDALANAEIAERKARAEIDSTKPVSPRKPGSIIQTEQPKKTVDDQDMASIVEEKPISVIGGKEWTGDDFGNVEISEEEQARLLQEYEAEIQEREMKKSLIVPLEEKLKLEEAERKEKMSGKQAKKGQAKNQAQNKKDQTTRPATTADSAKKSTTQSKQSKTSKQQPADKAAKPTNQTDAAPSKGANDDDSKDSDESWEKDFDLNDK